MLEVAEEADTLAGRIDLQLKANKWKQLARRLL